MPINFKKQQEYDIINRHESRVDIVYIQIIAGLAALGLIFLIINRIIRNLKFYTKSIINLGIGIVLGGGFYLAYYLDTSSGLLMNPTYYLVLFFASIGWGFVLFVIFLVKQLTMKNAFHRGHIKKEKKREYLYIVYSNGLDVYLEKGKLNGIIVKVKEGDFHDVIIQNISKSYQVVTNSDNIKKIGEAILIDKTNTIFHCYSVKLIDKPNDNSKLDIYDKRNITSLNFNKLDKQVIFRTLLEENFVIKFEKKEIGE